MLLGLRQQTNSYNFYPQLRVGWNVYTSPLILHVCQLRNKRVSFLGRITRVA